MIPLADSTQEPLAMSERLREVLSRHGALQRNAVAVCHGNSEVTYGEIARLTSRTARSDAVTVIEVTGEDPVGAAMRIVRSIVEGTRAVLVDANASDPERRRMERLVAEARDIPAESSIGFFSSGSAGTKKLVWRTEGQLLSNSGSYAALLGIDASACVAATTPLHHSYSVTATLLPALLSGATARLEPTTKFGGSVAQLAEISDVLHAVPVQYRLWLRREQPRAGCRYVSAGASFSQDLADDWYMFTGRALHNHYGLTECGVVSIDLTGGKANRLGTPIEGILLSLLPQPNGETELVVSKGELEVRTGDYVLEMPNGDLTFRSRSERLAEIGGVKVALDDLEQDLESLDCVRECAVVVQPGEIADQTLAFVVAYEVDELELRRLVASVLGPDRTPSRFIFVESLARTDSRKLDRQATTARYIERN